jgi:Putative amidoligase enzyme
MKIGIEIECWSPKAAAALTTAIRSKYRGANIVDGRNWEPDGWSIVGDGSLHSGPTGFVGVEIVSPVIDTDKATDLTTIKRICAALQDIGCTVDEHCGLHVHVDTEDMSVADIKRIFGRYSQYEDIIDRFMPLNRRGSLYYAKSGKPMVGQVFAVDTKSALARVLGGQRYWRVNLDAMLRHGTIEFRQHSGTINYETIMRWVSFLMQFITASTATYVPVAKKVRGRKPKTGMSAGCQKVYDCFMASYRNGGGDLRLETIAYRTSLSENSVKAYISTLKTKYGIVINKLSGQRGSQNPIFIITNPYSTPIGATTPHRTVSVAATDNLWVGVKRNIKAYYVERAMELSGFENNTYRNLEA